MLGNLLSLYLIVKRNILEDLRINFSVALLGLLLLLALSCFYRFYNLGSSEFQGDEARAAARLRASVPRMRRLFSHKKGPVEALLPYALLSGSFRLEEFSARFPFALAGTLSVLLAFSIAKVRCCR